MIRNIEKWLEAEGAQQPLLVTTGSVSAWQYIYEQVKNNPICAELIEIETCEKTIAIEAVRNIAPQVHRTVLRGCRLVAIKEAHKLSQPAANALLKILEEPPASTRFLLTTPWPQRLPATLRSRCQRVVIAGAPRVQTAVSYDPWSWLCAQAEGKPLAAEALETISQALENKLRSNGPSADVRRGYMRLRDYYRVTGSNGNEKAARDVLLGALLK